MTLPLNRILLTSLSGQLGGMEIRLADEARFLMRQGSHCLLAPSKFPGRDPWLDELAHESSLLEIFPFDPPLFFEDWRWHRLNYFRAKLFSLRRLVESKLDLAHIFYAWTLEGGSRLSLCHHAGIPSVLSVHNSFPTANLSPFHRRITAESFASVQGIYAVSESALQHFLATYGPYVRDSTITETIPNFVDIDRFVPNHESRIALRRELDIPESAFVIGSIGRLDVQKEPMQMLDLFEMICEKRSDVFLVFCGKGPLENDVRRRADNSRWASRIKFLGFRHDVEAVFPALDIHVLLSKQEGFGISTAEAMACGVPVIVTDVPGSRDVFHGSDAGAIVPYAELEAAYEAVGHLLKSSERRKAMGDCGRIHVRDKFSKSIWESRLGSFYQVVSDRTKSKNL